MGATQSKQIPNKTVVLYKTKLKYFEKSKTVPKISLKKIKKILENDFIKVPSSFKHNLGFIVTDINVSKNYTITISGRGSKTSFKSQIIDGIGENGHIVGKHRFYLYKPKL